MGLAGGIVRRVLSKSPCGSSSSAGGGRGGHSERSPGDHNRRWGSLKLYLCGDENGAGAEDGEDDDDGTVSARSFETCAMTQDAQAPGAADQRRDVNGRARSHAEQVRVQWSPGEPTKPFTEDDAAKLIQSAFRRFMARGRLLQEELRRSSGQECCYGEAPKSPASASTIAASVEVQVGESLSNLRLSDDGASVSAQHRAGQSQKPRPQVFRAKEEWDDSTLSSNVLRMRIQSKMEATTRRERALAYAFSQQLRSGGTKKRSSRSEQGEFNVGWSWLERWMATRQAEPGADDSASKNATDAGSAVAGRRVVVVRRRQDVAVEEKESCGSNDVSAISFDGSSAGARSGLSCYRPGKNRLRGPRNLPRRKVAAASSDHRLQPRSHKVSKKARQREEKQLQKDHQVETECVAYDPRQPPTDY
ncbi:hypothetical protein CFC21_099133 [Triticum aestivum]|uniref:Protein IQ-DOMAIN 1 n=2 Tax=Triticum aestivum TaxID=4565 RepID=A0A3B6RJP1_WHEAT|nr:uncharacterized protein LOC119327492 [Triticum dicoccoides]XP_044423852.1 protein IQ-DOMAIN 33-like [Triticum aestivum]KAF7097299.1 hypothetical protein CFC21_099133 [Triticum aestivum]